MSASGYLLVAYIALLGFLLFVLLFGEAAAFEGTVISTCHYGITAGIFEAPFYLLGFIFGERGERAADFIFQRCCESRNPLFQLLYLAILFGGYYAFHVYCMPFIPGPYLPNLHRYTPPAALALTLLTFVVACVSDPGVVTVHTVKQVQARYPFDGVLYSRRTCKTCKIVRPARAKHCRVCNRCIARFDHHCGWLNNCVGEKNLRYFLMFLAANLSLMSYGVYGICCILVGEVERHQVMAEIKSRCSSTAPLPYHK